MRNPANQRPELLFTQRREPLVRRLLRHVNRLRSSFPLDLPSGRVPLGLVTVQHSALADQRFEQVGSKESEDFARRLRVTARIQSLRS